MTNYLKMTNKDIDILKIIEKVSKKQITQVKAWILLNITDRQVRRKIEIYKKKWAQWLLHKARWMPSNHKHDPTNYIEIIKLRKEKDKLTKKLIDIFPPYISPDAQGKIFVSKVNSLFPFISAIYL